MWSVVSKALFELHQDSKQSTRRVYSCTPSVYCVQSGTSYGASGANAMNARSNACKLHAVKLTVKTDVKQC